MNVPLAKLMQSESIRALAVYVTEGLLEGTRGETPGIPVAEALAGAKSEIPLSGTDAANLLERIDDLTDEEIERHLRVLETQGQS